MRIDFTSSQRTSLGVEWELELVDLETRQLSGASDAILAAISKDGDGEHPKAKHELLQSCIEVITGICQTVGEAKADLAATVDEVAAAAAERNIGLMCSGTHPITDWSTQRITDNDRYLQLIERNQWMARQLQIFGVHVHCGIRSPHKAIPIVNALLAYLPHFLALSASSPYWIGSDTGLASYRSKVFEALPTAGLPYQLSGWDEFEQYMAAADRVARDRLHPRGVVGHPSAPELRHRRAAHLRRPADTRRDRLRRRAGAVPGRALRPADRQRLHAARTAAVAGAREQVARGPLRPRRRDRHRQLRSPAAGQGRRSPISSTTCCRSPAGWTARPSSSRSRG